MLERKFIAQKMKEHVVKEYLRERLPKLGFSKIELDKTPLGMRVIIFTSKPGLIVGRRGSNLSALAKSLKEKFDLENPQIEVHEVKEPFLDPQIMAESIALQIERFGPGRFKPIAFRALQQIMDAGARGVEIKIDGKAPGKRATCWRFRKGYLPKCGNVAVEDVAVGFEIAKPKPGVIGITVSILKPDVRMPDDVIFYDDQEETSEEMEEMMEDLQKGGDYEDMKEEKSEEEKVEDKEEEKEEEVGKDGDTQS